VGLTKELEQPFIQLQNGERIKRRFLVREIVYLFSIFIGLLPNKPVNQSTNKHPKQNLFILKSKQKNG